MSDATRPRPLSIPTVPDDFDQLIDLVITYGTARWEAGYQLANGDVRTLASQGIANEALDQIATLITQLQRKAGGGL